MMKWWHVAFFSLAYPFLMGNIRVYRFENHPKPIHAFSTIGLFFTGKLLYRMCFLVIGENFIVLHSHVFTAFSAIVYMLILFEIFSSYSGEPILSCHSVDYSVKNVRVGHHHVINTYLTSLHLFFGFSMFLEFSLTSLTQFLFLLILL